jgi:hypothetical protein
MLERQRDQISEPAPRHSVLARKEPVVGFHAELVTAAHRLGDEVAAHPPRDVRAHRRGEEEPCVGTVSRARTLDRQRHADDPARLDESGDVLLPRALVEIGGEKPACLVFEKRVHAHDVPVPALQMVEDYLITDRHERLVRALAALAPRLQDADAAHELVRALRGVSGLSGLLADEPRREDVFASAKQRPKEPHLLGRRLRRLAVGRKRELKERGRRVRCVRELGLKGFVSRPCLLASPLELRETLLLAGDLLEDCVSCAGHTRDSGARSIVVWASSRAGQPDREGGSRR